MPAATRHEKVRRWSTVALSALLLAVAGSTPTAAESFKLARTLTSPATYAFGHRVAAVGADVLVSAEESGSPFGSGACYLYDGASGAPLRTFENPSPKLFERFGRALDVSGTTLAIATQDGEVYLYDAASGALLRILAHPTGGHFESVAWVGGKVAAGDPYVANGGAVYVFDSATGRLLATLHDPADTDDDWFGMRIATAGDDLLVGAPQDDTGGFNAGAAYLFDGDTGALLQSFFNPDPELNSGFGFALAAVGGTVLIGAPNEYGRASPGAAYLFDGATGTLVRTLHDPTPRPGEYFGHAVAARGPDFLISANQDGSGRSRSGAVYLFDGATGALRHIFVSPVRSFESFGSSIAAVGDGVVVGAEYFGAQFEQTGAAYQFVNACGDGVIDPCETCDDGNRVDGDGCSADCGLESCGNGTRDAGEACDDGNAVDGDGCDADCTPTGCGNCRATAGEICDDGNGTDGDGCDDNCTFTECGNDIATTGETCDDGNLVGGDGCSPTCQQEICGNTVLDAGESCDDGNTVAGDGCSALCRLESQKLDWFSIVRAFSSQRPTGDGHFGLGDVGGDELLARATHPEGGSVQSFDVATGKLRHVYASPEQPPLSSSFFASSAFFAGTRVVTVGGVEDATDGSSRKALYVFDREDESLLRRFFPAGLVYDSEVAPRGIDVLIANRRLKSVTLVDGDRGATARTFADPAPQLGRAFGAAVATLDDQVLVGATGTAGGAVYRFDGGTGQHLHTYLPPSGAVVPSFGKRVAVVGGDVLVTGDHVVYRLDATTGALGAAFHDPSGVAGSAFGTEIAPFGDDVLVTAPGLQHDDGFGVTYLFDGRNGRLIAQFIGENSHPRALGDRVLIGLFSNRETEHIDLLRPCSDGVLEPGEECDDGNGVDGDGCDRNCTVTTCGNGMLTAGELCDDANDTEYDGCGNQCQPTAFCDAPITAAALTIRSGRTRLGDEAMVVRGSVPITAASFVLEPERVGARLRIEDLGASDPIVLDLAVPAGTVGTGCDVRFDGWRTERHGKRRVYRNRSTALAPPACPAGSTHGLVSLTLLDRRPARDQIDFVARTRKSSIATPIGPLRATIVLDSDAAASAACGIAEIPPTH